MDQPSSDISRLYRWSQAGGAAGGAAGEPVPPGAAHAAAACTAAAASAATAAAATAAGEGAMWPGVPSGGTHEGEGTEMAKLPGLAAMAEGPAQGSGGGGRCLSPAPRPRELS